MTERANGGPLAALCDAVASHLMICDGWANCTAPVSDVDHSMVTLRTALGTARDALMLEQARAYLEEAAQVAEGEAVLAAAHCAEEGCACHPADAALDSDDSEEETT